MPHIPKAYNTNIKYVTCNLETLLTLSTCVICEQRINVELQF